MKKISFAAISAVFLFALFLCGFFEGAERASLSLRLQLRGPRPASSRIAIVAIDEASLKRFGQFPWDRRLYARLLERLAEDGAKAVGFDIAFNEPGSRPGEDRAFAKAMRGRPVVLPLYRSYASAQITGKDLIDLQFPLPLFRNAARALGSAQFSPNQESPLLTYLPLQQQGKKIYPAFALALARVGGAPVSSDNFFLDPLGPARTFRFIPFCEALQASRGFFKDKFVLVGATAAGLPDTGFQSLFPSRGPISGIELHASVLDNLLEGNGLKRLSWPWMGLLLLLTACSSGPFLLTPRLQSPLKRLLRITALAFSVLVVAQLSLQFWNLWLDAIPLLSLLVFLFIGGLIWEAAALIRDRNAWLEWYNAELQRESQRQRERIDGELHDEAQQLLVALIRDLRRAPKILERPKEAALEKFLEMEGLGNAILNEIIRVRRDLIPHTLSRAGFLPAVEEMLHEASRRGDFKGEIEVSGWEKNDPTLENELYWILKECLNNAVKHSQAKNIRLRLEGKPAALSLAVEDDGQGFSVPDFTRPPQGTAHSGVHRLYMRITALGGTFELSSRPGEGTKISFSIPRVEQEVKIT